MPLQSFTDTCSSRAHQHSTHSASKTQPNTPCPYSPPALAVSQVSQLGLSDQVITGDPQAQFRYLYHKGQLRRLPNGLRDVLTNSGAFPDCVSTLLLARG